MYLPFHLYIESSTSVRVCLLPLRLRPFPYPNRPALFLLPLPPDLQVHGLQLGVVQRPAQQALRERVSEGVYVFAGATTQEVG